MDGDTALYAVKVADAREPPAPQSPSSSLEMIHKFHFKYQSTVAELKSKEERVFCKQKGSQLNITKRGC